MKPISMEKLSGQQLGVLHHLRYYPRDTYILSYATGFPEASVRRAIRELRQKGYQIQHTYFGYELLKEKPNHGSQVSR